MTWFLDATLELLIAQCSLSGVTWLKCFMVPQMTEPDIDFRKKIVSNKEDVTGVGDFRRAFS